MCLVKSRYLLGVKAHHHGLKVVLDVRQGPVLETGSKVVPDVAARGTAGARPRRNLWVGRAAHEPRIGGLLRSALHEPRSAALRRTRGNLSGATGYPGIRVG